MEAGNRTIQLNNSKGIKIQLIKKTAQNNDAVKLLPLLTGVPAQRSLGGRGLSRADVQVDAKHGGQQEGGYGQLQEVAVDVGEVHAQVHRRRHHQRAHHHGEET